MKTKNLFHRCTALLAALALLLPLASCGGQAKAATMHLRRAEGTVSVSDDAGKDVELLENLGLYSGYGVDTRSDSYAWIDLDSAKLTKLDQDSEIAITKEGKSLEIEVLSGSLFFNVTEPLAEDETMNICVSSMTVGIRGTCGWVESSDAEHMNLYLLEGEVMCSAGDETATVSAGEMAAMTEDGEITVDKFDANDVPAFVAEELEEDTDLAEAILDDSGIDVLNPPDPWSDSLDVYPAIIAQADTYDYGIAKSPADVYQYALEWIQPEDSSPTLFLQQHTADNMNYVRIFQYDPASGTVFQPSDVITVGVVSGDGYHGGLDLQGDGNGLLNIEMIGNTLDSYATITRITMEGGVLRRTPQWQGRFGDIPDDLWMTTITWYNLDDTSGLEFWQPENP